MSDGINHARGPLTYGPDGYPIDRSALHPPAPIAERLARLEIACERIWPAIRFFGLCGASPEYCAAMQEIGELIGKINTTPAGPGAAPPADLPALLNAAKREAQLEIAAIFAEHSDFREQCGRNIAMAQAEKIRKLQLYSD